MHNHNGKNNSSMIWMMLPCLLILVFAMFRGGGGLRSWPFLLVIGAMVVVHLWMMFRGHGHHLPDKKEASPEIAPAATEKKDHSDDSCCN